MPRTPSSPARRRVGSVNVPGYAANVNAQKYDAMKQALLRVLPRKPPGLTQQQMFDAVRSLVSSTLYPGSTHMWWVKCVQLDLEKHGVLARDSKAKPLRWVRAR